MGCNCKKQTSAKPGRTIVKNISNAQNAVRKATSGKRIIRRNIK